MPNIRPLSRELAQKAADKLNENPNHIQANLDTLRTWLRQSPHIRACTDDQFLVAFLRGSEHRMEVVKEKLDLFYTVRSAWPQYIRNRDPYEARIRELIRLKLTVPLPLTTTPDGSRLVILRPCAFDPEMYRMEEIFKVGIMIAEMMMQDDDNFVIAGQVAICDLKDLSMGHIAQATTNVMRQITMITMNALPYRTQTIHFINLPSAFNYICGFAKSFFGEAKDNLCVHDSLESLHRHIPRHCLPTEYGGDAGSLSTLNDQLEIKLECYSDYFKRSEAYGVLEDKRPGKPKNTEQLFGTDGTFRTLSID